jgi:hypothetical protein
MEQCIYCGAQEKITREHVIPRGIFPKGHKIKNPIIVSACHDCNNKYSSDEEFFRNFITMIGSDYSPHADHLLNTTVKRSIHRMPNIGRRMTSLMEEVRLFSPHGIYLGWRTKINIPPEDWERYHKVLSKIVKGLFYHETKRIIPEDYCIRHFWGQVDNGIKINKDYLAILNALPKWNKDNHPIFAYSYGVINDKPLSVWATFYYDSIFFLSFIVTEELAKNLDRKSQTPNHIKSR